MRRRAHAIGLAILLGTCIPFATVASAAVCPPFTLQDAVPYATGIGPVEVVAGDFTGDGITDLVTGASNYPLGPGSIQVFPGNAPGGAPDGTFGLPLTTAIPGVPLGLAAVDLDGDGRLDLVVGNHALNQVQVLRGIGGGAFEAAVGFPAGAKPYEVAVGDFNGDGVPDVAVADNAESSMRILLAGRNAGSGHWDGTFAPSVPYPTANLPLGIATGDINNDGILDVFCTESFNSTVAIFLGHGSAGTGDGTFLPAVHQPAGVEPYDISTGDFNEDGRLDLAVSSGDFGGLHVLLGSASGFFPVHDVYLNGNTCSGAAVADVDQDGIADLVVTHSASLSAPDQLQILPGLGSGGIGNGTFGTPVSFADCCTPMHLITGDFDADGRPDFATCAYTTNHLSVFLDGCSPAPGPPAIVRIRDVPNDQGGKVFLTWTRSAFDVAGGAVNAYRVWRQVPPGAVAELALTATSAGSEAVRRGVRVRADGTTDIVFWEALATLPAQRLAGYGYTAATPQDSIAGSNPRFTFYVSALTNNIDVFYDSAPDSGYSVDNLAPVAITGLVATRSAGAAQLDWQPNAAPDLAGYRVYRSYDPAFEPSAATLLATVTQPSFHDAEGMTASYRICAVDVHGNLSPFAAVLAATTGVGPGGTPGVTALAAPRPNPVHGALDVRLSLAHASRVSVALFDQLGRHVRTLLDAAHPAGELAPTWDLRDEAGHRIAPGLYFMRMRADGREQVRRVTVVR